VLSLHQAQKHFWPFCFLLHSSPVRKGIQFYAKICWFKLVRHCNIRKFISSNYELDKTNFFNQFFVNFVQDLHSLTCTACTGAIEGLLLLFNTGVGYDAFYEAAVTVCKVILDETVCRGALNNYFVRNYSRLDLMSLHIYKQSFISVAF
jgi:hypothetical protein